MTYFHSIGRSIVCSVLGTIMLLATTCLANAERPLARLDFETPLLQHKMLAEEPTAIASLSAPELAPRHALIIGSGLTIERAPERLSAGERWAIVRARVDAKQLPATATIKAAVYTVGQDKPLLTLESRVQHDRVWLWVDLRSALLNTDPVAARVVLTLVDGPKQLAAAEMSISAEASRSPMPLGKRVEVKIDSPPGLKFTGRTMPVTFGFPLPAGAIWEADDLRVLDETGQPVPYQHEVSGRWNNDGAVQWVRFDALAAAGATRLFVERAPDARSPTPAEPIRVTEADGRISVQTAGLTYVLGAARSPIQEIRRGATILATASGSRGLYVVDQKGRIATASDAQASIEIEARGEVTASVRIEGPMLTPAGETLARHITRLEFFAGQPAAKITHTLVLVNDTNEVWLKDVGWAMKTAVGASGAAEAVFNVAREDPEKVVRVQLPGAAAAWMLQDQHMRYQAGANHFAVASLSSTGNESIAFAGAECGDWSALAGAAATLLVGCRESARQHPKEFSFTADGFDLKLFSSRAGEELDFRVATRMEIWNISKWLDTGINAKARPGGEDRVRQIPSNAIGWSKTHELTIGILPAGAGVAEMAGISRSNSEGVFASADPRWIYETRVFGPLYPKDDARFPDAERLIVQTVDWWITRGDHVGEWGFVDAFSGPHMAYRGSAGMPMMRRFPLTYTLRRDLWMLYARSGDRDIRRANSDSVRTFMDGCMARWDGGGKTKGLYLTEGDGAKWSQTATPESVPMYWQGMPKLEISTTSDLNDFYWCYQLTGYRRAKEAITDYADAVRKIWTPTINRKQYRQMRLLLTLSQCYAYTGDETFRIMAEDLTGVLWEPQGAIKVRREKAYGAAYKMQSDTTCVDFAWRQLRDPRLGQMNDAVMSHFVNEFVGQHPFQYSYPMGLVAADRFEATGDMALAAGAFLSTRLATTTYDAEKASFGRSGMFAPAMRGIFEGLPYHMHLIARTDADRREVASWAAFEIPEEGSATVLVQKAARQQLKIRVVNDAHFKAPGEVKPGPSLRLLTAAEGERPSQWMLESNQVRSGESKTATATIAFDAPGGTYAIAGLLPGLNTVIVDAAAPLVVEARAGLRTSPGVRRVCFKLPPNATDVRLILEQPAVLRQPDGAGFNKGKPVQGEIALPAIAGLWSVELSGANFIRLQNASGVFGFNDASLHFDPPVAKAGTPAGESD